ncbi:acyltransferase [Streptococcus uberis]|uniref:acyltransferase n=2 Tax=Streptococcus uberis TaxID=1349 RepID=UPI00062049FC|nr:DapH/DapD/GlmU-related protein [Streptococcus uberis]MCK1157876.1 acyltransferase [Streptococcus uberis]MCK1223517.1 acyltransferase [Streptococcus uberis]
MDMKKLYWFIRLQIRRPFFKYVGSKSYLGPEVSIIGSKSIYIGNKVRIYPGSRLETHHGGEISFGDGCAVAQNVHITSGELPLSIGKNSTILGNTFITNIDHDYTEINKHILKQKMICKETKIGENCFIGFGASIQAGTILGKQCIVGTNAVVRGSFPDYSVIVGVPAKVVKRYDKEKQEWVRV